MRVIAGLYRGRNLVCPKGSGTRPTTDRVRESLMSALSSLRGGFDDAVILDAFAGTGALGIEALSRGGSWATFCEKDARALKILHDNLSFVDKGLYRVCKVDVLKGVVVRPAAPFDVIFLDPPYATSGQVVAQMCARLTDAGLMACDCIVCYEHDAADDIASLEQWTDLNLQLSSSRQFGDTVIDIFKRG